MEKCHNVRHVYDSVDYRSMSYVVSPKSTGNRFGGGLNVKENENL